jgi:hypothetical protein
MTRQHREERLRIDWARLKSVLQPSYLGDAYSQRWRDLRKA